MSTRYEVERIGHPGDDGAAGECGIRVVAMDGELRSHLLLHCAEKHTHGRACAQALLDAPIMPDGVTLSEKDVEEVVEVEEEVEIVGDKEKTTETIKVKKTITKKVEVRTPKPNISPRVVMERHLACLRAAADKVLLAGPRHAVESSKDNLLS